MAGLSITMTNSYRASAVNYKDLTIKINQTYVYMKDKSVYINGEVRATLPFKNDLVTVKRETTVFIVVTGNAWMRKFDFF